MNNLEKCKIAINELVKKHGMDAVLESLIARVKVRPLNRIETDEAYIVTLTTNLRKTLGDYKARYSVKDAE